jgi:hypothetical protein
MAQIEGNSRAVVDDSKQVTYSCVVTFCRAADARQAWKKMGEYCLSPFSLSLIVVPCGFLTPLNCVSSFDAPAHPLCSPIPQVLICTNLNHYFLYHPTCLLMAPLAH